jgi:hypothetical protein
MKPLNEVTRQRCRMNLENMNVLLSQVRIEKNGKKMRIAAYFSPDNAVDFVFDDDREHEEMLAYLIESGLQPIEVSS